MNGLRELVMPPTRLKSARLKKLDDDPTGSLWHVSEFLNIAAADVGSHANPVRSQLLSRDRFAVHFGFALQDANTGLRSGCLHPAGSVSCDSKNQQPDARART